MYQPLFCIVLRYPDGTVKLRNPHIELMDQDILYHLALGSGSHNLEEMFGDVKVRFCRNKPTNPDFFVNPNKKSLEKLPSIFRNISKDF